MVTPREPGNTSSIFKQKSIEYFKKYGRDDFVITRYTREKLPSGRLKSLRTNVSEGVLGDLQFDNKILSRYIYLGIAKIGDGVFYCSGDIVINSNDEMSVDGKRYTLTKQVEGETLNKEQPYQGWFAVLIPENG